MVQGPPASRPARRPRRVLGVHFYSSTLGLVVVVACVMLAIFVFGLESASILSSNDMASVLRTELDSTTHETVWGLLAVAGAFAVALQVSWAGLLGRPSAPITDDPASSATALFEIERLRRSARFRWAAGVAGAVTIDVWFFHLIAFQGDPMFQMVFSTGMAGVLFTAVDGALV
jgi:hypothetical protein